MVYLHDGLFDGFLTCIYEHYYHQKAEAIFAEATYSQCLFEEAVFIPTDAEKAKKVYDSILDKFSEDVYWNIFYTFLSDDPNKDCYLLKYLIVAFKMGNKISYLHTHEATYPVVRLGKKVMGERHRFLGILRFSEIGNCLYAQLEPDNDILMTLADHFVDRYKNERFIIHDVKRKKAIISQYGKWLISDFELKDPIVFQKEELFFQELWKQYFVSVGIEMRKNPRLQQQFVPLKYRKNIVEFRG